MKSLFMWVLIPLSQAVIAETCLLSSQDSAAVAAVGDEYVNAWLANDPKRVAAVLTEDTVMIPHHGVQPKIGKTQVLKWWFPDGKKPAPILQYDISRTKIEGCNDMAMSYGRLNILQFEYQGTTFTTKDGNYMVVYRKEKGNWKIAYVYGTIR